MAPPDPHLRLSAAFAGAAIYGDDFSADEIAAWYADEENGYASLDHQDSLTDIYVYHALDAAYYWPHLRGDGLDVLGLGSAWGSEFKPIASRIARLSIVEPAEKFWQPQVAGVPAQFVKPQLDGALPFETGRFDLVTALGVLHHIPNVSAVLAELVRVLKPGGLLAVREPITSMGDWRRPRPGLTARERGLPWGQVAPMALRAGCVPVVARQVGFGPLVKLATRRRDAAPWNHPGFVRADALLSTLFSANYSYHRTSLWQRFAPTVGVWLFRKGPGASA